MRITSWMYLIFLCLFSKTAVAQVYIDLINAGFSQNLESQYKGSNNNYQQQTSWLNANIGDFITDSPYQGDIKSGLAFEIGVAWRKRTARKFKYQ